MNTAAALGADQKKNKTKPVVAQADEFYLQDSRSYCGSGIFWWKDGGSYTTNLAEAAVFSRERALHQHEQREHDIPWLKSYVDSAPVVTVDHQYVDGDEAAKWRDDQFYVQCTGQWDGNDIYWLTADGSSSIDLTLAGLFSRGDFDDEDGRTRRKLWPKSYIDTKTRKSVRNNMINLKKSLNLSGIKLIKPKKPAKDRYSCAHCGRFLSEATYYGGSCGNCGSTNY